MLSSYGIIFYQNKSSYIDLDKEELTGDCVELAREFLKKVLKVERLHVFGELSKGQMVEKFDYLQMRIHAAIKKSAKTSITPQDVLINIITLGPMKRAHDNE